MSGGTQAPAPEGSGPGACPSPDTPPNGRISQRPAISGELHESSSATTPWCSMTTWSRPTLCAFIVLSLRLLTAGLLVLHWESLAIVLTLWGPRSGVYRKPQTGLGNSGWNRGQRGRNLIPKGQRTGRLQGQMDHVVFLGVGTCQPRSSAVPSWSWGD